MKTRIVSREYPKDNDLNIFGDYTHLEAIQTRSDVDRCRSQWQLVNRQTGRVEKLSQKEVDQCLRNLFFIGATIEYK